MNRVLKFFLIIFIIFIIIAMSVIGTLFFLNKPVQNYQTTTLKNPIDGLTEEQALAQFDESFVQYLLYSISAQNLHNPPASQDTPKIEVKISDQFYFAEISKGTITVTKENQQNVDIEIQTTKEEAIKMLRDKEYVVSSFKEGKSSITIIADKTTLFLKGYAGLSSQFQ